MGALTNYIGNLWHFVVHPPAEVTLAAADAGAQLIHCVTTVAITFGTKVIEIASNVL